MERVTYLKFQEYNLNSDNAIRFSFSHVIGIGLPQPNYIPFKSWFNSKTFQMCSIDTIWTHKKILSLFFLARFKKVFASKSWNKIDRKVEFDLRMFLLREKPLLLFRGYSPSDIRRLFNVNVSRCWSTHLFFCTPINQPNVTNRSADFKYTLK